MRSAHARSRRERDAHWMAGFSECDITPRTGHATLSGFACERNVTGILTPLKAQALALADARGAIGLIIAADVIAFDLTTVQRLRRQIRLRHRIPAPAVILAASHTHWGPGIGLRRNPTCADCDTWYLRWLEESLLALVTQAIRGLHPCRISYGASDFSLGCNRRLPDGKGHILWGPNPSGSYDTHTPVLHLRWNRPQQQLVLVGHACHPTSTGRSVEQWSADYPGAMRDHLERKLGNDSKAMFVMGCGGDTKVAHRENSAGPLVFSASPPQARQAGEKLADHVLAQLADGARIELAADFACHQAEGMLSLERVPSRRKLETLACEGQDAGADTWWARLMLTFPDPRRQYACRAQAWRLGRVLTLFALEGEVCSPFGPMIRALARTDAAMVVAYVNSTAAYIPTRQIRIEGGYEGKSSHTSWMLPAPFTKNIETEFMRIVKRAVAKLS